MTKVSIGIHKVDHSTFGGFIKYSDFNTNYRGHDNLNGSVIASRIISDSKFDERCRKQNIENKKIRRRIENEEL